MLEKVGNNSKKQLEALNSFLNSLEPLPNPKNDPKIDKENTDRAQLRKDVTESPAGLAVLDQMAKEIGRLKGAPRKPEDLLKDVETKFNSLMKDRSREISDREDNLKGINRFIKLHNVGQQQIAFELSKAVAKGDEKTAKALKSKMDAEDVKYKRLADKKNRLEGELKALKNGNSLPVPSNETPPVPPPRMDLKPPTPPPRIKVTSPMAEHTADLPIPPRTQPGETAPIEPLAQEPESKEPPPLPPLPVGLDLPPPLPESEEPPPLPLSLD